MKVHKVLPVFLSSTVLILSFILLLTCLFGCSGGGNIIENEAPLITDFNYDYTGFLAIPKDDGGGAKACYFLYYLYDDAINQTITEYITGDDGQSLINEYVTTEETTYNMIYPRSFFLIVDTTITGKRKIYVYVEDEHGLKSNVLSVTVEVVE